MTKIDDEDLPHIPKADDLSRRVPRPLTGSEPFLSHGAPIGADVLAFWRWSASDLVSNALRGRVAEFLVAHALGVADGNVRTEWDAYDLRVRGGPTIEVKSSAYLQSWAQRGASRICFGIQPTRAWSPDTNEFSLESRRQADLYVFALLHHRDKATLDPLDTDQWTFFVLATEVLDAQLSVQREISLRTLEALGPTKADYQNLAAAVWRVFRA